MATTQPTAKFALNYYQLHTIMDALARFDTAINEGFDPTEIYFGVFPSDSDLRHIDQYRALFTDAMQTMNDMVAASGPTTRITITTVG